MKLGRGRRGAVASERKKPAPITGGEIGVQEDGKGCSNNVGLNHKGDVTDAHLQALCTSRRRGRTTSYTFHSQRVVCIDLCADFTCQVIADDNLGALIENTVLGSVIIH